MAKFIVIDGLDGCGKATQTDMLKTYLESIGKKVIKISFPKYDSDSSAAVRMYLGGKLGNDPTALNPYMCGTFYAVDRFIQYVTDWKKYFDEDDNTIIVADRYLSANIIHQAGKIASREERLRYAHWNYNLECDRCGLPKEDITIVLTIKPEISQKLMSERYKGDESKKDIHESSLDYLNECYERLKLTAHDLSKVQTDGYTNWVHIQCEDSTGENVDTRENIHQNILKYVNEILGL